MSLSQFYCCPQSQSPLLLESHLYLIRMDLVAPLYSVVSPSSDCFLPTVDEEQLDSVKVIREKS